jgi:hypothetical protein
LAIACAIGCSEALSTAAAKAEDVGAHGAVQQRDLRELHLSFGDRARLVEHDRVDVACLLEDLGALDQHPHLRATPGADHQRGRSCESEGAGTGDDQHRDRCGEGGRCRGTESEPAGQRQERQDDHDRDEDRRDAIGEPLHRRLARLRFHDEARDLGKRGLGADAGRAHDQATVGIDGRARELRSRPNVDRGRLAGQHRLVDGRAPLFDDAVGGDLLAGTDDETVADAQLLDRDDELAPVPQEPRLLRAQLEQGADRGARAAPRAGLEITAEQDERGGHRADLEIGARAGKEEECRQRPTQGGKRAERDQRVHRRRAVTQVERRGPVEAEATPEHDRGRQPECDPFPAVKLKRRDQCERGQRCGQSGAEHERQAQAARRIFGLGSRGKRSPVAGRLDCTDQVVGRDPARVVADRRLFGRVVDGGLNAVEPVQLALDPRCTGGTGHPLQLELEPLESLGRGRHQLAR